MAPRRMSAGSKKIVKAASEASPAENTGDAAALMSASALLSLSHGPRCCVLFPNVPLLPEQHFNYTDDPEVGKTFGLRREIPLCTFPSLERTHLIRSVGSSTLRALVTDVDLETPVGLDQFVKPSFLFGDHISADGQVGCVEDSRMLRRVDDRLLFLPSMKRMYPLSYFLSVGGRRGLAFDLVKEKENISFGSGRSSRVQIGGQLKGLRPGRFEKKELSREAPLPANMFIRQFLASHGEFPAQAFRSPGWLFSGEDGWWTRMVDFVLEELKEPLIQSGLTISVQATRRGIVQNYPCFYAMLERYNPDSCTFFTPVGELGFALHEMHAISGLSFGQTPYEEFVPTTEELSILKTAHPEIYDTFWELMCHFHICAQVAGTRGNGLMHTAWADYLFQNLGQKDSKVTRLAVNSAGSIKARIRAPQAVYKNQHLEHGFEAGSEFESFHHQAATPISDMALFAGFLMLWLKRCVVPSRPTESILAEVVYPAVLLAHGKPLSLLPAMTGCLQKGLRDLTSELLDVKEMTVAGRKVWKTFQPRVPMPYTYLAAWFVLHCPSLMTGIVHDNETSVPFIQRLESATWTTVYIVRARQLLSLENNYDLFCCRPCFDGAEEEGPKFGDVVFEGSSLLNMGTFQWLLAIRVGYLVLRLGERCIIEPYIPSRFARQFGYDQLYVGNPNPRLAHIGNLYEGARAWYFFLARGTHARFTLPSLPPSCSTVVDFRDWFDKTSQIPEYDIYTSCINEIRGLYKSRSGSGRTRLPGIEDYLSCEREAAGIEEISKELPVAKPSEEEDTKEVFESAPLPKSRSLRSSGKKALTADEVAKYDKKIRKRKPTAAKTSKKSKLMGDAIKSAHVASPEEKEETILPATPSGPEVTAAGQELTIPDPASSMPEGPSSKAVDRPIRTDYANCFTYPTAPPPSSETLRKLIEQLEHWMQMTIDVVSLGDVSFKVFEPHLLECVAKIKDQGNILWTENCREGIIILEYELEFLSMLQRDDIGPEVDQALSEAKALKAQQQEVLQKSLSEAESRVAHLRGELLRAQGDMGDLAIGLRDKTTELTRAGVEIPQINAQLADGMEIFKGLAGYCDGLLKGYCDELAATDKIRRELTATAPNEEELKSQITEEVKKAREDKISALKSKLKSFKLMDPNA